eukprot:6008592-Alexandrium_andersonii.AAC.1
MEASKFAWSPGERHRGSQHGGSPSSSGCGRGLGRAVAAGPAPVPPPLEVIVGVASGADDADVGASPMAPHPACRSRRLTSERPRPSSAE